MHPQAPARVRGRKSFRISLSTSSVCACTSLDLRGCFLGTGTDVQAESSCLHMLPLPRCLLVPSGKGLAQKPGCNHALLPGAPPHQQLHPSSPQGIALLTLHRTQPQVWEPLIREDLYNNCGLLQDERLCKKIM